MAKVAGEPGVDIPSSPPIAAAAVHGGLAGNQGAVRSSTTITAAPILVKTAATRRTPYAATSTESTPIPPCDGLAAKLAPSTS
mmetsp:Transcript_64547/g.140597  ORF Transcript_64547/g.140597 Transcript_64547/m.140597 type:complete len:83 (-) Transcript_64547:529-777(-)